MPKSVSERQRPEIQKESNDNALRIDLPKTSETVLSQNNLWTCIATRRTQRQFSNNALTIAELSFLLWATQGVTKVIGKNTATLRTVPSACKCHAFETYLVINQVQSIEPGLYRYLPLSHQLVYIKESDDLLRQFDAACANQTFVKKGAVIFIWSCIPQRAEAHSEMMSHHKAMLLDAGHVCQNLYLAATAINCGTCAIAAYDQQRMDHLLDLDGEEEFVIYLAPVGKKVEFTNEYENH